MNKQTVRKIKNVAGKVEKVFCIITIILFSAIVIMLIPKFYAHRKVPGKVNNVLICYETSKLYSQEDIDKAIPEIAKAFVKYNGCILEKIIYAGDEESLYELERVNKTTKRYEEVIILKSTFRTTYSSQRDGFTPNETYSGWKWILGRNDGGEWELIGYGYA